MDFVDGQPSVNGLLVRSVDAMQGEISDLDHVKREVMVRFPHEKVDTYKTTFGPDCFRESFATRKPVVCWQHQLVEPIGRATEAQVTRSANEMVAKLDDFDAVPLARRAFAQIESGTLTDWSFGFRDPQYEPHPQHRGVRRIKKASMKEMSPVTIGSIPGAIATGTREEVQVMAEQSIKDIIALRDAKMISPEAAADMIRQMVDPSIAEHIIVIGEAGGGDGGEVQPDGSRAPYTVHKDETVKCASCGKMNMTDAKFCDQCGAKLEGNREAEGGDGEYVVPDVINGAVVMEALPEPLQRALAENEATLWITLGDDELVPASLASTRSEDGAAPSIAANIAEACRQGVEYFAEVEDLEALPEQVRQAHELMKATGVASVALVEMLDPDGAARAALAESRDGAEDMASHPVTCSECDGKGETEDGKTCPKCDGSGVEAVERAMPDDAPEGSKSCGTCKGDGKLPAPKAGGHRLKCQDCKGKGWQSPSDQSDMEKRADSSKWSEKPWSDFSQADYTPEQWKSACLVVEGDGSKKSMCHLPVKEPDGTYNVNGIAAAAGRIKQLDVSGMDPDYKADAAHALASLYHQMGKDVPPDVAELAKEDTDDGADDKREDKSEDIEAKRQHALARLDRHVKVPASA